MRAKRRAGRQRLPSDYQDGGKAATQQARGYHGADSRLAPAVHFFRKAKKTAYCNAALMQSVLSVVMF
jgi:hypothetical protein